jgi:hypothetical protein
MARMKTGRLTTKTTPPEKYVVTSKRETVQPRQLTSREAKYNADVEAGEKYKSDLAAYNEKKKAYDKSTTEADKSYALFGGKQNTRSLAGSELAEYNKKTGSNYSKVEVSKDLKKVGEKDMFFGSMDKPIAPNKVTPPNINDMPMGRMPLNKITSIKSKQSMASGKKEKSAEGWFNDYVPTTKGTSNKQLKQFASYASKTGLNESFIGKSKEDIGEYKNEMKSQRKSYAKEGNLAGIRSTTADIRQAKNAAKFIGSKNPLDQPGMVKGYRKEQEVEAYRQGFDNPANRNTIKSQVDRLKKLR